MPLFATVLELEDGTEEEFDETLETISYSDDFYPLLGAHLSGRGYVCAAIAWLQKRGGDEALKYLQAEWLSKDLGFVNQRGERAVQVHPQTSDLVFPVVMITKTEATRLSGSVAGEYVIYDDLDATIPIGRVLLSETGPAI